MAELATLNALLRVAQGSGEDAQIVARVKSSLRTFESSAGRLDRDTAKAILSTKVLPKLVKSLNAHKGDKALVSGRPGSYNFTKGLMLLLLCSPLFSLSFSLGDAVSEGGQESERGSSA